MRMGKMAKTSYVPSPTKINVVGLGDAGCNAITRIVREQVYGVEFIAMNTDVQYLEITEAPVRIALEERLTHGLGAGGDHNLGRRCAEETHDEIKQTLAKADMVFLAAGMGGGTGTGAIPVVAKVARQSRALTVAIVTVLFTFEGEHRMQVAEEGISQLVTKVDTLIIIVNDRLLKLSDKKIAVDSAFKFADEILWRAVQQLLR
jgi:cell division protein FtsZ